MDVLRAHAEERGDRPALVVLEDGERETGRLSYAELDRRARAVAAALQQVAGPGERALVTDPLGLDYVTATLGCLYAGVIAVPCDAPTWPGARERLEWIARDARPRVALGPPSTALADNAIDAGGIDVGGAGEWRDPRVPAARPAVLQYTSGSTRTPRGVLVTHANLMANERAIARACEHDQRSTFVGWLPLFHDMGLVANLLQPLFLGALSVLMPPRAFLERPLRWLEAVSRYRAHTSGGPNFAFDLCAGRSTPADRTGLDLSAWRVAFNGAETVRHATLERFSAAFGPHGFDPATWFPCYGLAESTLIVTATPKAREPVVLCADVEALQACRCRAAFDAGAEARVLVSSGVAAAGQGIAIVEPDGARRCAPGEIGEIWLAGPSTAAGYWERPDESARTFAARLAGEDGGWLRTGDLGALVDGELFVVGRSSETIVIRGQNHFPHDIEWTVEEAHPAVRRGCVAAFGVEEEDEERLVLACELRSGDGDGVLPDVAAAIRAAIAARHGLHAAAIAFLPRDALPKTTSGKLPRGPIRRAYMEGRLAPLAVDRVGNGSAGVEPASADGANAAAATVTAAEALRELVANALRLKPHDVPTAAPLAGLGLDSIAAIELQHRLEERCGVRLPPGALLSGGGIDAICATAAEAPAPAGAPQRPAAEVPLSGAQRGLWYESALDPASPAYNLARAVRLRGPLDPEALARAFERLTERHEALRTRFTVRDGEPHQRFDAPAAAMQIADASALDEPELAARLQSEAARPFALGEERPLRLTLLRRSAEEHVLLLVAHHTIADLWSFVVVLRELGELYAAERAGRQPRLPPAPPSYAEHVALKADLMEADAPRLEQWWRQALAGAPTLELPAVPAEDGPGPAGTHTPFALDAAATARLRDAAQAHGATLHTALLAGYAAVLHRFTGQNDLVVGTLCAGRDRARFGRTVGAFVNTLPVRVRCDSRTRFDELIAATHDAVLAARAHGDLPLDRIVRAAAPARDGGRSALPRSLVVLQREQGGDDAGLRALALGTGGRTMLGDVEAECVPIELGASQLDLSLHVAEFDSGLHGLWEHRSDLLPHEVVVSLGDALAQALAGAAADPATPVGELALIDDDERRRLLDTRNETTRERPAAASLHGLVADQAARTPDAAAVTATGADGEPVTITYEALSHRARAISERLRAAGVGPGDTVGLLAERSADLPPAVLGILGAGAAYMPLSPTEPAARLATILARSVLAAVLVGGKLPRRLAATTAPVLTLDGPDAQPTPPRPLPPVHPQQPAYVIHTSGSTGPPKAVAVPHAAAVNRILWMQKAFGLTQHDRVLHKTPLTFDVSVWELLWPLTTGACLVVAAPDAHQDPALVANTMSRERVTCAHFVPSMLAQALDTGGLADAPALRLLVSSGEALTPTLRDRVHAQTRATLANLYGPTEAAIDATAWTCARGERGPVPIGTPIANVEAHVLDGALEPVPIGATGDLCLGGAGLAHGYRGEPAATAQRFRPDPHSGRRGARLYRTGDRARRRPDGALLFLGRDDGQVKVAGNRVEVGEVVEALRSHPAVADAAVTQPGGRLGDRLAAYVVPARGAPAPTHAELLDHLRDRLPAHMLPAATAALGALPLTASGKVNGVALPPPVPPTPGEGAAPATDLERRLLELWRRELGQPQLGVEHDFHAAGGDSIRAIRIVGRARERGLPLTVADLLREGTVRRLAERLAGRPGAEAPRPTAPFALCNPDARERQGSGVADAYPLSMAQRALVFRAQHDPRWEAYVTWIDVRARLGDDALREAAARLAARHRYLRSRFDLAARPEPLQVVDAAAELELAVSDLRDRDADERDRLLRRSLRDERRRPFDLAGGPLARFLVDRLPGDRLRVTLSSFALDGWCVATLLAELLREAWSAERGEPAPPAPLRASFADFVALELEALRSPATRAFWEGELGAAPDTRLPRGPGAGAPGAELQQRVVAGVREPVAERLERLARELGVPLRSVLLGAHLGVVRELTGTDRLLTGLELNGRPETPDGDRVIGVFNNILPLVADVPAHFDSAQLARLAFELEARAAPHRRYPFAQLARDHAAARELDTMFVFTHFHAYAGAAALEGVELLDGDAPDQTYVPLTAHFDVHPLDGRLRLLLDHDPAEIPPHHAEEIAGRYLDRLEVMSGRPARSSLPKPPHPMLPELIARQAARAPDAIAAVSDDGALSYGALDARARRLAAALAERGAGPDRVVGLHGRRDLDLLVGLLGILYAGAAFLPLDPSDPPRRLADLLRSARASVVVGPNAAAGAGVCSMIAPTDDASAPAIHPRTAPPAALAYVMFTSGSTSAPKAIGVAHLSLAAYAGWAAEAYGIGLGARVPLATRPAYDMSVTSLLVPLAAGATVRLVDDRGGADALATLLAREPVDVLKGPPSYLHEVAGLLAARGDRPRVGTVVFGGESLDGGHVQAWQRLVPDVRIVNEYGPTETTVGCCAHVWPAERRGEPSEPVPIGVPVAGACVRMETGTGELLVGGPGVARGYLDRPALTAASFRPDPRPGPAGGREYRTGDVVHTADAGLLVFAGRRDRQVKLRGFRVELDEVERALAAHPEVERAAAVAAPRDQGGSRLVAFAVTGPPATAPPPDRLRTWLADRLAAHMVPAEIVAVEALPLTPAGKLDHPALTVLAAGLGAGGNGHSDDTVRPTPAAPRTDAEAALAAVWSAVLGVEEVGIDDDYFRLGGDSILAIAVVARAQEAGIALTTQELFERPTIRALAPQRRTSDAVPRPGESEEHALEPLQQGILYHALERPDAYVVQVRCRIAGPLAEDAFRRAWELVTARHPALRTYFELGADGPRRRVAPAVTVELGRPALPGTFEEWLAADRAAGVALAEPPLMRLALLPAPEGRRFVWTHSHLLLDGWSQRIVLDEVLAAYAAFSAGGRPAAQQPAPAELDRAPADPAADEAHWRRYLAPPLRLTHLAETRVAACGATATATLAAATTAALASWARRHGLTTTTVLHGGWALVLAALTGADDVLFGSTVSGRPPGAAGAERAVGMFANTLPVRVQISPRQAPQRWLKALQRSTARAWAHDRVPLSAIERWAGAPARGLFDTIVVVENFPGAGDEVGAGAPLEVDEIGSTIDEAFPLVLEVTPGRRLRLRARYDPALLDRADVEWMVHALALYAGALGPNEPGSVEELAGLIAADRAARTDDRRGELRARARTRLGEARRVPAADAGERP